MKPLSADITEFSNQDGGQQHGTLRGRKAEGKNSISDQEVDVPRLTLRFCYPTRHDGDTPWASLFHAALNAIVERNRRPN
jgi:hypothetical protein